MLFHRRRVLHHFRDCSRFRSIGNSTAAAAGIILVRVSATSSTEAVTTTTLTSVTSGATAADATATAHLFSPANAKELREGLTELRRHETVEDKVDCRVDQRQHIHNLATIGIDIMKEELSCRAFT